MRKGVKKTNVLHATLAELKRGNVKKARDKCIHLCQTHPSNDDAWALLGSIHGRLGNYMEAVECSMRAASLQPKRVDSWSNAAYGCLCIGHIQDAIRCYRKAIHLAPSSAELRYGLGTALRLSGNHHEAINELNHALVLKPAYSDPHYNLGLIFKQQGAIGKAIASFERALRIQPDSIATQINLAFCLQQEGRYADAIKLFDTVLQSDPSQKAAHIGKASTLEMLGAYDQAIAEIDPLLASGEADPMLAEVFAAIAPHVAREDDATTLIESVLELASDSMQESTAQLSSLNYKLGNLYESAERFEKAFECYVRANQVRANDVCPQESLVYMESARRTFTHDFFRSAPHSECESDKPIFIVGMPRSGTSLVEQILASHSKVFGAGELEALTEAVGPLLNIPSNGEQLLVKRNKLSQTWLAKAAKSYLDCVGMHTAENSYFTDKMPHNFLRLGFVALLFPNARVIHCARDPMDTCLSIYCSPLTGIHSYANNLMHIGAHYQAYQKLMKHWHEVLPLPILDIQYEALVSNQHEETMRLLKFCRLDWEETCLHFHESKRIARTLSYNQVRQPLYRSSVQRWKNYDKHLSPLMTSLGLSNL